jgi:hypothetical protein
MLRRNISPPSSELKCKTRKITADAGSKQPDLISAGFVHINIIM